jgi:putative copper resistance protein D
VAQLLDLFGFLSVLLRGLTLAFEALTIGGVFFLTLIASDSEVPVKARILRVLSSSSLFLTIAQIAYVTANAAILKSSIDITWQEVMGAGFATAAMLVVTGAIAILMIVHSRFGAVVCPVACALILAGSVMASHSVARVDGRPLVITATAAHHIASAAWIGGLPYLLLSIRNSPQAAVLTSRFSRMAMTSVSVLLVAGAALAFLYIGSVGALIGTTYGAMVASKATLTALLLGLGALNFDIVRHVRRGAPANLAPLQRFSEAEIGIGFTAILVAASLTSTPPAIDVGSDRVPPNEIVRRVTPVWPRLQTPALNELSPVTPLATTPGGPTTFVPGQVSKIESPSDIAWSEYNHHWAGLVVVVIGMLALLARKFPWAMHWPLAFLGLAVFLLIRADAENWPLGPRGFWESFRVAEVAQHRIFVLLIVAFAAFEWSVQNKRLDPRRAALVFPLVCALGGALLMTHSHSLGNVKEEFLAELSHIPLAILAVIAGWARWLEIRLPAPRLGALAWIWPICFIALGCILLNYRES